jgi:hypothetical protein
VETRVYYAGCGGDAAHVKKVETREYYAGCGGDAAHVKKVETREYYAGCGGNAADVKKEMLLGEIKSMLWVVRMFLRSLRGRMLLQQDLNYGDHIKMLIAWRC